jgi:hypothetical protein
MRQPPPNPKWTATVSCEGQDCSSELVIPMQPGDGNRWEDKARSKGWTVSAHVPKCPLCKSRQHGNALDITQVVALARERIRGASWRAACKTVGVRFSGSLPGRVATMLCKAAISEETL